MSDNTEEVKHSPLQPKKDFLPEFYVEVREPFFEGKGNHSVSKLEKICEGYKEYAHQADIAFYACSRQLSSLKSQLSSLQEENERLKKLNSEKKLAIISHLCDKGKMESEVQRLREALNKCQGIFQRLADEGYGPLSLQNTWGYVKGNGTSHANEQLFRHHEMTRYLLSIGMDLFGLIESGLAIELLQDKEVKS